MTRSTKFLIPAFAGALLALTACDIEDFGGVARYSQDFHYSYPLRAGGSLAVETFNGSVEVTSWDQQTVDISGTKTGPTQEAADSLKVSVENSPDSVSVRVVRPSEWRNNLGARFVIKVPHNARIDRIVTSNGPIRLEEAVGPTRLKSSNGGIRVHTMQGTLDAQTSNGPIDLEDVTGDVTAHSSNGHIHATHVAGSFDATTSNNGITAAVDKAGPTVHLSSSNGPIELTLPPNFNNSVRANTSNNSITLHLPAEPNAHLIANTSNSSISTDFDVQVHGDIRHNHMDANLGSGGPTLDLSTSNGPIRLIRTR